MRERAFGRNRKRDQWLSATELRHIRNSFRINRDGSGPRLFRDWPIFIGAGGE
jgi:hypothetical protein